MMKLSRYPFTQFIIFSLGLIFFSCEKSEVAPDEIQNEYLIDYELLETIEANQLKIFIGLFDQSVNTDVIRYDVEIYRVTYLTEYQGNMTEASGLLCVPLDAKMVDFPIFLGFHASISSQSESPSNFSNPIGTGLEFFASLGFIGVIPDYLGFGVSSQLFHPYLVKESVTQVSTDMVRAAAEMMDELNQSYERQLYLAGYSQGAYNTIATLSALENDGLLPDWEVAATAAGAGTYDLKFLTEQTLSKDNYASPEVLSYLIWSYHNYYNLEGDAGTYFQEPYASLIPSLFDGNNSLGEIGQSLTTDLTLLLQPDFLSDLRNGEETVFYQILEENSIPAWTAKSPINLLHAPQDEVIGFENSTEFVNDLEEAGSASITFTSLSAPGHTQAAIPMLINTLFWLENFRNI